ncbi:MAG: T9SS type A sorting domain-containing protein, partial [Bacteroidetes bacterium]|nr:T9SS type A sorting domain-containing protein [Bacteroidota bacterium]
NVWPGDTDNSGSVDEQDVLALAYYWGETGNVRKNASLTWAAQQLYAWENEQATYSDTDGQGSVNQNDLRAIIANYGKTTESEFIQKVVKNAETQSVISMTMQAVNKGDHSFVELYATERMEITGLSFKVNSSRPLNEYFKVVETNAGNWAANWEKTNQFISFTQQNVQEIGIAFSALGSKEAQILEAGDLLVSIEVEALAAITDNFEINLSNPSVRTANGQLSSISESASVLVNSTTSTALNEDFENKVESFELMGNYPNPFNPSTSVRFQLAERSDVSVRVYDIQGKEVAVLAEGSFGAGVNEIPFFAANLSSGTYLYAVQAGNDVKTAKMTLVK